MRDLQHSAERRASKTYRYDLCPTPIRRHPCLRARLARAINLWLTTPRKDRA